MRTTWLSDVQVQNKRSTLKKDITADVAIIGGGLAGIWCAYLLSQKGKNVVILERGYVGEGVTAYTTAFISQEIDTSLSDLTDMFGPQTTQRVWQSHGEAIDLIEKVIKKEKIECDFMRCPAYIYATDERQFEDLEKDHQVARKYGFQTKLFKKSRLRVTNAGVWEIGNQAKYHPLKFLLALTKKTEENGTIIFEKTEVTKISGTKSKIVTMKNGHTVTAKDVIVTTYMPFNNPKQTHYKKGMYVSYALELEIPKGYLSPALYWDMNDPYNY